MEFAQKLKDLEQEKLLGNVRVELTEHLLKLPIQAEQIV